MIDWTDVDRDDPSSWIALAARLVDKAHALLSAAAPAEVELRASQDDLAQFVAAANLRCPDVAITAARRTSDQVTRALQALHLADLELRNATLDAIKARMSSAANELRADAAHLQLHGLRRALTTATAVTGEVKLLLAELKALRKDQIPERLAVLVTRLESLVAELGGAAPER